MQRRRLCPHRKCIILPILERRPWTQSRLLLLEGCQLRSLPSSRYMPPICTCFAMQFSNLEKRLINFHFGQIFSSLACKQAPEAENDGRIKRRAGWCTEASDFASAASLSSRFIFYGFSGSFGNFDGGRRRRRRSVFAREIFPLAMQQHSKSRKP